MPNLLTAEQAQNALRVPAGDARVTDLLPQVDEFIKSATGRDWTQDATIHPMAVSAATMLLVQLFENPGMMGESTLMTYGLTHALTVLEATALKYRKVEFEGRNGSGSIWMQEAYQGDVVIKLVGVYGVSGSRVADFETVVSETGYLLQTSTEDLSDHLYVVVLKSPGDDVGI